MRDQAFNIAKITKNDGYQRDFASMAYRFFKFSDSGFKSMPSQQLLHELHQPIIKKKLKKKIILII